MRGAVCQESAAPGKCPHLRLDALASTPLTPGSDDTPTRRRGFAAEKAPEAEAAERACGAEPRPADAEAAASSAACCINVELLSHAFQARWRGASLQPQRRTLCCFTGRPDARANRVAQARVPAAPSADGSPCQALLAQSCASLGVVRAQRLRPGVLAAAAPMRSPHKITTRLTARRLHHRVPPTCSCSPCSLWRRTRRCRPAAAWAWQYDAAHSPSQPWSSCCGSESSSARHANSRACCA
jgi:hypothetical protein